MKRCRIPAIVALVVLAAAPALGADHQAAQAHFEAGRKLQREERWAEAAAELQASLAIEPSVGGHLNLGNVLEKLGKTASAQEQFRRAEALARGSDPERAAEARRRIDALAPRVATITVTADARASAVTVDGVAVASAEEVPVDPGLHAVAVSAPGKPARRLDVTVRPGEHAKVVVAASEERPLVKVEAPPPRPGSPSNVGRTAGLVGVGVGVAALAVGGVFYGLASSDKSKLTSACATYPRCRADEIGGARDLDDSARTKANVATALGIGGLAAVAVGGVLAITSSGSSSERKTTSLVIAPSLGGVAVAGAF